MSKDIRKKQPGKGAAAAAAEGTGANEYPVIVAGIGVGAGGTKSLKQLLAKIPSGLGIAYVLVLHPGPSKKILSVRQLKKLTALAVVEATDGMPVLADRIHVIPPDKFLNITGSRLTLQEPVHCNGLRMPIDHFFCSLAADQRRRGCGIVLSGAGSDGTLGLSEIKAAGGRTFVEDPGSAGVPRNAAKRHRRGRGGRGSAGRGHGRSDCGAGGAGDRETPAAIRRSRRSSTPTCGPSWISCAPRSGMTSAATSPTPSCGGFAGG